MTHNSERFNGLTSREAAALGERYGKNTLQAEKHESFAAKAFSIVKEPMFVLLLVASTIYFLLGEARDGAIMLVFVLGIISIDIIQEWKTDKTLAALKNLSAPRVTVIRDGVETEIFSVDLVPGDVMLLHEGVKVPADGVVIRCSDLCVDESTLTGESVPVWKTVCIGDTADDDYWRRDAVYAGTLVTQGTAAVYVEKIGMETEYGKIGAQVTAAREEKTPLQKQTSSIVKISAGIAAVLFALVGAATYINIPDIPLVPRLIQSLLSGVTLAMAMIPEEFPVILTVFLSMGAWRIAKNNALVRRLPSVETLGAVSVLCVDKTGTITQNKMTVREVWAVDHDMMTLCEVMGLGCETDAYDPMENAILEHCQKLGITKEHLFGDALLTEFAFTNELKMMGHVWRHEGEIILAAKGSPERLLALCDLSDDARGDAERKLCEMSGEGLRVIAVASAKYDGVAEIPESLTASTLHFNGLVGLYDPPREHVARDIAVCNRAGIRVVMITGDNGITASAIARQVGIPNSDRIITGDMLDAMNDSDLREQVKTVSLFSRVIPAHKMRIVQAFRENGHIVAMTGDGVNDAPALKNADIGIAMGGRGSEVSREAADLILLDDNFSTIVDTVHDGRRIYDNIRKAVGYVFTIHIPIAFSSLLGPMLGIAPESLLLLPLHVVLLELIIDPTCSVVLERQPAETGVMDRPPRSPQEKLLTGRGLLKSIIQGLVILAASFGAFYMTLLSAPGKAAEARAIGLVVLMLANLFLVFVNSSECDHFLASARRMAGDKIVWASQLGVLLMIAVILYTPLNTLLKLAPLSPRSLLLALALAAMSVLWYEIVKLLKRRRKNAGE
ncbi:cation-translocating P-type ATPase [Oscillospiraceae bacterium CM]|nr:cation-translocating P-type ATPase [Oscillospiraceae bacterium CM]